MYVEIKKKGGKPEMWRSKKFIVAAVLATVILVGSIGGVVMAADGDGESGAAARSLSE